MTEICNTSEFNGDEEIHGPHLQATTEPTTDKMQFHVQMDRYTQEAMEELIVEAAARLLIGKRADTSLAKQIETRCAELLMQKLDAKLETITTDIINQPVTPQGVGSKPVTMGEMIGLMGKDYLTEPVNSDGKPKSADGWGFARVGTRAQWLVSNSVMKKFEKEVGTATYAAISEMQSEVKRAHAALLNAEKARLSRALNDMVKP